MSLCAPRPQFGDYVACIGTSGASIYAGLILDILSPAKVVIAHEAHEAVYNIEVLYATKPPGRCGPRALPSR